jgi:hypothetical protein
MRLVRKLPLTPVLERELCTFTAKITNAGNETFAADWRQGAHDDLVLAAAIAGWVGENLATGPFEVTKDKQSQYMIADAPDGVFVEHGRRGMSENRECCDRDLDIRWPW